LRDADADNADATVRAAKAIAEQIAGLCGRVDGWTPGLISSTPERIRYEGWAIQKVMTKPGNGETTERWIAIVPEGPDVELGCVDDAYGELRFEDHRYLFAVEGDPLVATEITLHGPTERPKLVLYDACSAPGATGGGGTMQANPHQSPNPKVQAVVDGFERMVCRGALGVAALIPLSFCGGVGAFVYGGLVADAPVFVHHDGVGEVTVWVDGEAVAHLAEAGGTLLYVPRGDRVVEVTGARERRWVLDGANGLDEWLLPTNPDLCFAVVDVGRAQRGAGDVDCAALDATRVTCIYRRFPKRELGSFPIFAAKDLPAPGSRRLNTVWLAVPCHELHDVDSAVLLAEHLGCAAR